MESEIHNTRERPSEAGERKARTYPAGTPSGRRAGGRKLRGTKDPAERPSKAPAHSGHRSERVRYLENPDNVCSDAAEAVNALRRLSMHRAVAFLKARVLVIHQSNDCAQ